jgi:hypothetical protein
MNAPTPTPRLVCRDHHDQPVTARGKGCTICAKARQTWRDRRRRRTTRRRDVDDMNDGGRESLAN